MDFTNALEARRYCEENGIPLGPLTPDQGRALTAEQNWARIIAMKAGSLSDVSTLHLAGMREAIEENEAVRALAEGV